MAEDQPNHDFRIRMAETRLGTVDGRLAALEAHVTDLLQPAQGGSPVEVETRSAEWMAGYDAGYAACLAEIGSEDLRCEHCGLIGEHTAMCPDHPREHDVQIVGPTTHVVFAHPCTYFLHVDMWEGGFRIRDRAEVVTDSRARTHIELVEGPELATPERFIEMVEAMTWPHPVLEAE